jgi:hypothetical protein
MSRKRIIRTSAILFAWFLVSASVSAQQVVYKWTDEDGVVHFGEAPPAGVQAERIVTSAAPAVPATPAPPPETPAAEGPEPAARPQAEVPPLAGAADERSISEMSLAELDARCESAREALIAPLREAEIERCKAEPRTDPASCERRNADFGAPVRTVNGTVTPRMFHDIPPCLDAQNERRRRQR